MPDTNNEMMPPNLEEAEALLSDLFQEVQTWEGTLAGGTKLGVGAEAVDSLRQSKVSFGNPRDRLIQLTDIDDQKMPQQWDFYSMTLTVDLRPARAAKFWRLTCQLDFGPKGSKEPIVHSLFPTQKWRSIMSLGVGMEVGLNGNLDWNVGVDSSQLAALVESLPGKLKANVGNKDEFKAVLAIPAYQKEDINTDSSPALTEVPSVDYKDLEKTLQQGRWESADSKTSALMLTIGDRDKNDKLYKTGESWSDEIDNFPCSDLIKLDDLWVRYSDGKFGFSVQKEIYLSLDSENKNDQEIWNAFIEQGVGWQPGGKWLSYDQSIFNVDNAPKGHLPRLKYINDQEGLRYIYFKDKLEKCNI